MAHVSPSSRSRAVIVIAVLSGEFGPVMSGQTPTPTPIPAAAPQVMEAAITKRDSLPAATGSLWRFEGPFNQDNGGKGIVSGRINEIAIHPTNRMIMYATAPTGGVWKTTDGGTTWASRSNGWPIQSATAVAIDPNNGNRIFVGTGDYKRLDHIEPFSVGIMRSLDGGLTWLNFGAAQMHEQTVSRIVVDPNNQANILAATGRGSRRPSGQIFRSANTGANWGAVVDNSGNPMPDGNWDDLEVSKVPSGSGLIFWASATRRKNYDGGDAGGANGLLYQSRDSGATWTNVNIVANGFTLNTAASRPDTIQIAARPSSTTVFVAVFENGSARVFVSGDGGTTWNEQVSATATSGLGAPWAHSAFCITPNNLYLAGTGMFIGQFIEGVGFAFFPTGGPIHEDIQCIKEDPLDPNAVFVTTDGGIYHYSATTNKCTSLSSSLGVTQVYRMDVHDRDGALIGIGAQDLGNSVSFAGNGNTPADLLKPPAWAVEQTGDGRSAAFRGDNTARVYLSNTDGRVRKYDGTTATNLQGTCAADSQAPLLFNNDTVFDADTQFWQLADPESKECTAADFCSTGLCKIQDAAGNCNVAPCPGTGATANWMPSAFRIAGPPPSTIQALGMCSSNKQTIYAGSQSGELFESTDGGGSWPNELPRTTLPAGFPLWAISPGGSTCNDVVVGIGYDSNTVRNGNNTLLQGSRVFRNTNAPTADSWTPVIGDGLPQAPTYAIVRNPTAPDMKWYVGNDVGVFRTDNAGVNWTNATAPLGLPNTLVRDLRMSADGKTLYAGTFGRGVWSQTVDPPPDHFGVRGILTQGGAPVANAAAVVTGGPGRVEKWLKNLITNGSIVTTAPIDIPESTTIANASAVVRVRNAEAVSLIAPDGTSRAMTLSSTFFGLSTFTLPSSSAAAFIGKSTKGKWSFSLTGTLPLKGGRLSPSLLSAMVSFGFTDLISALTGPDGEYTIEYLARGSHVVSIFDCDCQTRTIDFQSNQTGVNFQAPTVGEFVVQPVLQNARVGDELFYTLAYTITEGRSWHDLTNVQLRFSDDQGTVLWILFDAAKRTFSLVDPKNGNTGPDFPAGRPNRLETSAATFYLADTQFVPNVPDRSSVTLTLALSFKPGAADRTYQVQVLAKDVLGHTQGPEAAGTVQVGR